MHTLSEQLHAKNMVRLEKSVCVCLLKDAVGALLQMCYASDRGGCWNALKLPVQQMLMCCTAKMI